MVATQQSRSRFSVSAALAVGFPAVLCALLVALSVGMRSELNPVEAGLYLLVVGPICLVGGLVSSVTAVLGSARRRWAGVTGLLINGLAVACLAASLLLSA